MSTNSFSMKVEFEGATKLADRFDALANKVLLRLSAADVVNEVATRFQALAKKEMNAGLNLSDEYIASRMRLQPATPGGAGAVRAEVEARGDLTVMSHFPYAQLSQPNRRPGGKGDAKRGIAPGRKQAGVATEIRVGGAVAVDHWFTMTLRRGRSSGEQVGVFYRNRAGQVTHKYGPSPYSLFRHQIETHQADVEEDLQRTAAGRMADAVQKALT